MPSSAGLALQTLSRNSNVASLIGPWHGHDHDHDHVDGDGEDDGNDGGDDDEGDGESAYKKDLRLSYKGGFPNGVYQDKNIETEKDVNQCLCPREMTMTMF